MSKALSKTEQFLKVGPYVIWFGMHVTISLILSFQRSLAVTTYYLVTYVFFGSLIIWLFGYKLFPTYLAREGKINKQLGLLIGLNMLLFIVGIYSHTIMSEVLGLTQISDQYAPKSVRVVLWVLMVVLGLFFMASIRITRVYYLNAVQKIVYKAERAEAELKLLKSQISPHFLFNTLNNIYGLAYLRDERAAEMISKLSKLLRYLLYDCDQPKVLLTKEKELIEHYLSIQLLKHEDSQNVDFYHAGITNNHMIAPMILINFIENCFKHSDLETNPEGWIKISLEVDKNELVFSTENTYKETVEETAKKQMGIGLTNSLKLLKANYPLKHDVEITKEHQIYQLNLKITL
ncbi:sensor histidine kinase [Winogradskyella echinorum]|uniref:Sensor histidine kinase n=1 Tax=Winogradskyella echinorum TaxID=538189 RepID=A0ABR6Y0M5_9FLAO|nr:sensor histidine kinase [Winogradskyella echinorum]MBC3846298.1 sensor histidine kinase [Winogradskyella echinorum]MBC5750646.1 sensor histidine kinase [Winogradskyella echinorum]